MTGFQSPSRMIHFQQVHSTVRCNIVKARVPTLGTTIVEREGMVRGITATEGRMRSPQLNPSLELQRDKLHLLHSAAQSWDFIHSLAPSPRSLLQLEPSIGNHEIII